MTGAGRAVTRGITAHGAVAADLVGGGLAISARAVEAERAAERVSALVERAVEQRVEAERAARRWNASFRWRCAPSVRGRASSAAAFPRHAGCGAAALATAFRAATTAPFRAAVRRCGALPRCAGRGAAALAAAAADDLRPTRVVTAARFAAARCLAAAQKRRAERAWARQSRRRAERLARGPEIALADRVHGRAHLAG